MVCLDVDTANKTSKRTYFTIHRQNCATHKVQWVRWSCLTDVCCFVFFANILDVQKIQFILFFDCESWVVKLSCKWYFVKCSCRNSLDHISILHLIPVKQPGFIPREWTCQSQIITRFNHQERDLVGNVCGLNQRWREETNNMVTRQQIKTLKSV